MIDIVNTLQATFAVMFIIHCFYKPISSTSIIKRLISAVFLVLIETSKMFLVVKISIVTVVIWIVNIIVDIGRLKRVRSIEGKR